MHDDHEHHHGENGHEAAHGPGHNHSHADANHLHSHPHGRNEDHRAEELAILCAAFVEGFRASSDKASYLKLAGIPFTRTGSDGLTMYLVDVSIASHWQMGTASPAFGSRQLSYLPYPGPMITEHEAMSFTYVSMTEREDVGLTEQIGYCAALSRKSPI
jgi:hypothetical protein